MSQRVPAPATQQEENEQLVSRAGGHGDRGLPPLPSVSLASLPNDALLNETEVATYVRAAVYTVSDWRRRRGHPLAYLKIYGNRVRYLVADVKAFIAAGERRMPKARDVAAEPGAVVIARPKTETVQFAVRPIHTPSPGVAKAVALFGSQLKLARTAGISKNTLFETLHGYRNVSHKVALALAAATEGRVTAEELLLEGTQHTPPIAPDKNKPPKPVKAKRTRRTAAGDEHIGAAE